MLTHLADYSPLLITLGFMIAAIAVVVRLFSNATRRYDAELDLEAQAALCQTLRITEAGKSARAPVQPLAPSTPHAPARRVAGESTATTTRPLSLLQLDHVSAHRPLKLALRKA